MNELPESGSRQIDVTRRVDEPASTVNTVEHVEVHRQEPTGVERNESVVRDVSGQVEHHEQTVANHAAERQYSLAKAEQIVRLVVGVIEGLIAIRIVLRLIGANPQNAFAVLVYGLSGIFVDPFITLTASPEAGRVVLEIPSLIAMAVYALLGWAIVRAIWIIFSPSRARSQTTFDRYRT